MRVAQYLPERLRGQRERKPEPGALFLLCFGGVNVNLHLHMKMAFRTDLQQYSFSDLCCSSKDVAERITNFLSPGPPSAQ